MKKSLVQQSVEADEAQKAKRTILKDKEGRIQRCKEKIDKALGEEKCILQVQMIIEPNRNIPIVNVVAQE